MPRPERTDPVLAGGALILGVHHIGLVVPDIPEAAELYTRRYGYELMSEIILDRTQTAYVQFLRVPGDSVQLELVSPDSERSKLSSSLRKGGGLNHLCYVTSDIDAACRRLRAEQMILLQAPVKAAAFPGRRIAWLMGNDRTPIELLESASGAVL
jgi:methylmalonyl-CoA/ethylmalonyl-CoA epimerase